MRRLAATVALAALLLGCDSPDNLAVGQVRVIDGDTLEMLGTADLRTGKPLRIRLMGIDAPERGTIAGARATAVLKGIILGRSVTCALTGDTSYNREVARCFVPEGDLGCLMINASQATEAVRFSKGLYAECRPGVHPGQHTVNDHSQSTPPHAVNINDGDAKWMRRKPTRLAGEP